MKHQKVHFCFAQMLNKQIGWAWAVDCIHGVGTVFRWTQWLKL